MIFFSSQILHKEFTDLLKTVWNYTRPDAGHTLTFVPNSASLKFQLHLVALRILDLILENDLHRVTFLTLDVVHIGAFFKTHLLFDE